MFGSFVFAEGLGRSGLITVPIADLYIGNRTMRTAMSDETRTRMTKFWEVLTFMATSFAFLLTHAPIIIAAFLAILAARILSAYPIIGLTHLMGEKIPRSSTRVISFAGLRGAVSVALALSLTESTFKGMIVAMTFGVALLSLIVQAEILQLYVRTLKLNSNEETPK